MYTKVQEGNECQVKNMPDMVDDLVPKHYTGDSV